MWSIALPCDKFTYNFPLPFPSAERNPAVMADLATWLFRLKVYILLAFVLHILGTLIFFGMRQHVLFAHDCSFLHSHPYFF